jgi:hypothetical protein
MVDLQFGTLVAKALLSTSQLALTCRIGTPIVETCENI